MHWHKWDEVISFDDVISDILTRHLALLQLLLNHTMLDRLTWFKTDHNRKIFFYCCNDFEIFFLLPSPLILFSFKIISKITEDTSSVRKHISFILEFFPFDWGGGGDIKQFVEPKYSCIFFRYLLKAKNLHIGSLNNVY